MRVRVCACPNVLRGEHERSSMRVVCAHLGSLGTLRHDMQLWPTLLVRAHADAGLNHCEKVDKMCIRSLRQALSCGGRSRISRRASLKGTVTTRACGSGGWLGMHNYLEIDLCCLPSPFLLSALHLRMLCASNIPARAQKNIAYVRDMVSWNTFIVTWECMNAHTRS